MRDEKVMYMLTSRESLIGIFEHLKDAEAASEKVRARVTDDQFVRHLCITPHTVGETRVFGLALSLILAVLFLFAPINAHAQDTQTCFDTDYATHVCTFSSGRVVEIFSEGSYYQSTWYPTYAAYQRHVRAEEAKRRAHTNTHSEAEAQSWRTQDSCEGDGFVWRDGGCHAKGAK